MFPEKKKALCFGGRGLFSPMFNFTQRSAVRFASSGQEVSCVLFRF